MIGEFIKCCLIREANTAPCPLTLATQYCVVLQKFVLVFFIRVAVNPVIHNSSLLRY